MADARYVTIEEVRALSGVTAALVGDDDLMETLVDVEFQVERFLNNNFTPSVEIDVSNGTAKPTYFTRHAPLLTVRSLEINETSIDLANIRFNKSGKIELLNGADTAVFVRTRTRDRAVIVKYVHADVEWDKQIQTTSSALTAVGTSVAITVADEKGFAVDEWLEIFGTDGNRETAQITAVASGSITVDELVFTHVSGSEMRRLKIPFTAQKLIKIYSGIAAVIRAVGESFDDITGYTIEGFQVQKGEPFTQFRETINQLIKERDLIEKRMNPTPVMLFR